MHFDSELYIFKEETDIPETGGTLLDLYHIAEASENAYCGP